MAPPRRWIRVDVGWSDSEWVGNLEPGGRLAWIELLAYVRSYGVTGRVRRLAPSVASRRWDIPADDVAAMESAAVTAGVLELEDGGKTWALRDWQQYFTRGPRRGGGSSRWKRIRAIILARDSHTCRYCSEPANQVDHVVPRSRGGRDEPDNLVAACGWCNRSKKDQTPEEWRGAHSHP
jgi:hypothetical protein